MVCYGCVCVCLNDEIEREGWLLSLELNPLAS